MKAEKQIREFEINYPLDWTYEVKVSKLREDLDALERLGVTRVDIEAYIDYDYAHIDIKAISERMETDEEFSQRIETERREEEKIRILELDQLEKLKLKYGV